MSGRVMSVVLCRPTVSGDIVPIAMGNCENIEEATKYNTVQPPSDTDIVKLIKSRVRTYFNNDGVIELDGGYHLFYVVVLEPFCTMIYCCVGEQAMSSEEAQQFLNEKIRTLMASSNIQMGIEQANPYDLLGFLQPDILKFIKQYNEKFPSAHQQRMINIRQQVDEVRNTMADNVERILERGERLDNITMRAEELRSSATSFKSTARRVQRHFCQKNLKWTIIMVVFVVALVLGIVLTILHKNGKI